MALVAWGDAVLCRRMTVTADPRQLFTNRHETYARFISLRKRGGWYTRRAEGW